MELSASSQHDFATLLELAESRFDAWYLKKFDRKITGLPVQLAKTRPTALGQYPAIVGVYMEFWKHAIQKRMGLYAAVAREFDGYEMFSGRRLDEFRSHHDVGEHRYIEAEG